MNRAAILASFMLCGCTVGPDFHPPAEPTVTQYHAPDEAIGKDIRPGAVGPGNWWTLYGSSALDDLVRQGVAGSPTLESAAARLEAAQETYAAAVATGYPQATLNASATRAKLSPVSFGFKPGAFPLPANYNAFQVAPSFSYPLDLFGGIRRRVEQQGALAEGQRQSLRAATLDLIGNIVAQAIEISAARAELKVVNEILEIDRRNLELTELKSRAGEAPDTDVAVARTQLATDTTLRPDPEFRVSTARHALANLIGRTPGEFGEPELDLSRLTLPESLPLELPSALVHQRPDILLAEAQLHTASAQIGIATAELYPDITLSGSIGVAALDPGHLFDPAGLAWSIAAGLTQPLFDAGMREAQRRAALAQFKAQASDYQQTVLDAFRQIADLLQAQLRDGRLSEAEHQAVESAAESLRLQKISYSGGQSGILELFDAERSYQQARIGEVRARSQHFKDTSQLFSALGRDPEAEPHR